LSRARPPGCADKQDYRPRDAPAPWLCRSGSFPDQARNYHAIPRRSHGGRGYRNAWSVSGAGIRPRISSNLPIHPVRQGLDRCRLNQPRWLALLHRSFNLLRCCHRWLRREARSVRKRSEFRLPPALNPRTRQPAGGRCPRVRWARSYCGRRQ
jgi:hypothetical protein